MLCIFLYCYQQIKFHDSYLQQYSMDDVIFWHAGRHSMKEETESNFLEWWDKTFSDSPMFG